MTRLVVLVLRATVPLSFLLAAQPSALQSSRPAAGRPTVPSPPAAPAGAEKAVPFKVGETLTYDVSWSTLLTAGTAVLTVQDKKPSYNSTAYYIVAEGRPTPLVAKLYPTY